MFGLLNITKALGMTSHDVVARVRRLAGREVKVGHAGTLDPFATGVLVVCLGPATRLADYVKNSPKRYRTTITLGATSSTDDIEGEIIECERADIPALSEVRAACDALIGGILQTPPAHSAVHVDGQRAYKLARKGQDVQIAPRPVRIDAIDLLNYEYPSLELDIQCGRGTYIRAIARDIGDTLGLGGYCRTLERTAVGAFSIDNAKAIEDLQLPADLQSPMLALPDWATLTVPDALLKDMNDGKSLPLDHLAGDTSDPYPPEVALIDSSGSLLAIAEVAPGIAKPRKVFRIPE
jgi:tRNA pseudouridine55 synthase